MILGGAAERLVSLLWETTWQGALFAVCVAVSCVLFRVSATHRALLWVLVCLKFVLGFVWLLCFGEASAVSIAVPWLAAAATKSSVASDASTFPTAVLLAVWGIGAALGLTWLAVRAKLTADTVRHAIPYTEHSLLDMLTAISVRLGLMSRRVPSAQGSPQVTLWRAKPVIVFPRHLLAPSAEALSPDELRFVLAHELAHVRRGDLWIGLLFAAAQALFFFHPCIYWARQEWEAAREEACDALALSACGTDAPTAPAQYGALLLRLGNGRGSSGILSASMAASPFSGLRRRLRYLETWQKNKGTDRPSPWRLAVTAPLLAVFFVPLHLQPMTSAGSPARSTVRNVTAVVPAAHPANPPRTVAVASAAVKTTRNRRPRLAPPTQPEIVIASVPAPAPISRRSVPVVRKITVANLAPPALTVTKTTHTVGPTSTPPSVTEAPISTTTPSVALVESLPSNAVVVTPQSVPTPRLSRSLTAAAPPVAVAAVPPTKPTDDTTVGITPPGIGTSETTVPHPTNSEATMTRSARPTPTGETARPTFPFPLPQPSPSPSPLPLTIPVREPLTPNLPNH